MRFDDAASLASARAIVASDVPGDAALSALSVEGGMLRIDGTLGLDQGSRWATLGAEIAPGDVGAGADLSGASVLRIRLASAVARPLRVRIKGGDREIGNAGCYPVVVQRVTPSAADYVMPLAAFESPRWCGTNTASIEQTLRSVLHVEVTANDEPAGTVSFSVGPIEFLADAASEPEPERHPALPLPPSTPTIAPAPHRRSAAAASAPATAPSRRVTCEFSTRYQLMLCY